MILKTSCAEEQRQQQSACVAVNMPCYFCFQALQLENTDDMLIDTADC